MAHLTPFTFFQENFPPLKNRTRHRFRIRRYRIAKCKLNQLLYSCLKCIAKNAIHNFLQPISCRKQPSRHWWIMQSSCTGLFLRRAFPIYLYTVLIRSWIPDHCGSAGELQNNKLLLLRRPVQLNSFSSLIWKREGFYPFAEVINNN